MASKLLPDNPLTQRARKWKKDQGIVSLTLDELLKKVKDKEFIAEQKVDGQSAIMEYKNEKARFASLGGRIITDIPVLAEIELILKKQDVKSALMVGELAGVENGKIILFDKTESLIKNPAKEKDALHWFPYQLLEINGEEYGEEFETYKKTWPQIVKLFNGAKRIESVKSETVDLKKAWESYVEKQGNEGLVVRTSDNKVYKCKSTFHYDLVVVAVGSKKGKNWPKKMIGNTLMAFMDENKIFRIAGEVGTGWTDEESKDLFNWARKNKVGEDNTYVWVKPERIMEIEWERSNIRPSKAYKYENGKYIQVDNKPVGTIVKPRFLRYRKDKSVTPKDLSLTQIPDWEKRSKAIQKMARRIACKFMVMSVDADDMKMHKVVPKARVCDGIDAWPAEHWIPICESCMKGEHVTYGWKHLPPNLDKLDPNDSTTSRYSCKNVGHIDGKRVQCGCTASWPELLEEIKKSKKAKNIVNSFFTKNGWKFWSQSDRQRKSVEEISETLSKLGLRLPPDMARIQEHGMSFDLPNGIQLVVKIDGDVLINKQKVSPDDPEKVKNILRNPQIIKKE
jgi:hypothetical protein